MLWKDYVVIPSILTRKVDNSLWKDYVVIPSESLTTHHMLVGIDESNKKWKWSI